MLSYRAAMLENLTRLLPFSGERSLAGVTLPTKIRKVVATKLSTDFRAATEVVEVERPGLLAGQALFRMCYAAVNASDVLKTNGYYGDTQLPFDLGLEGVGQVMAVGSLVPSALLGRYMVLSDTGERAGCFADYRVVDLRKTYAVPVPKAKPEYATIMVTGISMAVALNECAKLGSGETVLITAAAGSGGTYAVQMAKKKKNHVIGTCGGSDKVKLLYELGCDRVINYREEDVGEVLAREYPEGVDLALDSVGGDLFDTCVDHLAERGRLVVFGYISDYKNGVEGRKVRPVYDRLLTKSAQIRGFAFKHYARSAGLHAMTTIRAVIKKQLRGVVDPTEFVGVDSIVSAVEHHQAGKNLGKVVVRF